MSVSIQTNKDDGIHLQAHRGGTSLDGIGSEFTIFLIDFCDSWFRLYSTLCTHHIVAQGVVACV